MPVRVSLGRVARTKPHLLADTAEIALLYGLYGQISEGDLLAIIRQSLRTGGELLSSSEEDIDDDDNPDDMGGAEINKREQGFVEECFRQIEFRVSAFGESYPFYLENNILYVRQNPSAGCFLYVLLLICSRSRSFNNRTLTQTLSERFEDVSAHALRGMVSGNAAVIQFGAAVRQRLGEFSTDLREAIPQLAKRMGVKLAPKYLRGLAGQGDGKIDLVAIYAFDEYSEGYHVILGQCAAIEEEAVWSKKRQECMMSSMRGFFSPLVDSQAFLFVPVCYRGADGAWVRDNEVSDVVAMDRLRIMFVIGKEQAGAFDARSILDELEALPAVLVAA